MEHGKQKNIEESVLSSGATFNNSFNLSSLPPHDISIVSTKTEQIFPSFSVKGSDLIEFVIPSSNVYYTNLSKTFLYLRLKAVKSDGTALDANSKTSVVNLIHSTLFKSVDVYVNNILISQPTGNYSYAAFINRVINATKADFDTKLICEGYAQSTSNDPLSETNNMYKTLLAKTKTNKIELYSVLNHSLFEIKRLFPPTVTFRIQLRLNSPKFCLLSTAGTATAPFTDLLVVEEAFLDVCRTVANSKITSLHEGILSKNQKIHYPFRDRDVIAFSCPTGNINFVSETLLNKIPSFCLIGLLDSKAYYGQENLDPFSFFHNGLTACNLLINGQKVMHENFKFSVADKFYMKLYRSLFNFQNNEGQQMLISEENFTKNGMFLVPLLFTDDSFKTDRSIINLAADIKVSLQFKEATTKDIICVVYFMFDKLLSLNRDSVFLE